MIDRRFIRPVLRFATIALAGSPIAPAATPNAATAIEEWLWRVTWHEGIAYGVAYSEVNPPEASSGPGERNVRLYRSHDGVAWERVTNLAVPGRPGETTQRFDETGRMVAVVRREAGDRMGWLGTAAPPFRAWHWNAGNRRFGGPNLLQLPDRSWLVGTREYPGVDGRGTHDTRMLLARMDPSGRSASLLELPSGGDCSYPGLAWHDGLLWVSYYSSHEGKSAIYLAQVRIDPL